MILELTQFAFYASFTYSGCCAFGVTVSPSVYLDRGYL